MKSKFSNGPQYAAILNQDCVGRSAALVMLSPHQGGSATRWGPENLDERNSGVYAGEIPIKSLTMKLEIPAHADPAELP